jgi:hypothetical protein
MQIPSFQEFEKMATEGDFFAYKQNEYEKDFLRFCIRCVDDLSNLIAETHPDNITDDAITAAAEESKKTAKVLAEITFKFAMNVTYIFVCEHAKQQQDRGQT